MHLLTVSLCQDSLAASKDRSPESKTSIIVDGVICLSQEDEVSDGWIVRAGGEVGEDHSVMYDVFPAPFNVITGHKEDWARVLGQELLHAVKKEIRSDLLALEPRLQKVDVVCSADVDTENLTK